MTNLNPSSDWLPAVAFALLLAVALAAPAAAVSVGETTIPDDAEVGTQVTATVALTELYRNPTLETWQLSGETELRNVTWVVEYYDQTGARIGQDEFTGQRFAGATVSADEGTAEVRVRVTGTVPEVSNYSYDPPQRFLLLSLTRGRQGGATSTIDRWRVHHFTAESDTARDALDAANRSIGDARSAGATPSEAVSTFESAVSAYENGNFGNAERLASRAQSEARSAKQSAERRRLALFGGAGLLAVVVLGGGVVYWRRSREDDYDRLS